MLRSVKSLEGFSIGATDGIIGKVDDFYFDDEAWVVTDRHKRAGDDRLNGASFR
jgi:hypothetical protein